MTNLTPMSFRFTEDIRNKIKWTAKTNGIRPVQLLSQLVEMEFKQDLDSKLQDIASGKCLNPVDELVELLDSKFIGMEYVKYSMPISPKLRELVLKKIK